MLDFRFRGASTGSMNTKKKFAALALCGGLLLGASPAEATVCRPWPHHHGYASPASCYTGHSTAGLIGLVLSYLRLSR